MVLLMVLLSFLAAVVGFFSQDMPPASEQARTEAALQEKLEQELVERSSRLLRSKLPRAIAWGAHLAAKHKLSSLAKLVVARLSARKALPDGSKRRYLTNALLDAVIRLHARVPVDDLVAIAKEGLPQHVCILLAERLANPDKLSWGKASRRDLKRTEAALLQFFVAEERAHVEESSHGLTIRAAGALLAERKDTAFVEQLVRELEIELTLFVRDDGRRMFRYHGGGHGASSWPLDPDGFPPIVVYPLDDSPSFGARLLCAGPPAIFYRRVEVGARHHMPLGQGLGADIDSLRLSWLAAVLKRTDIGLEYSVQVTHQWSDQGALRREVKDLRAKIDVAHGRLIAELVAKKLLTPKRAKDMNSHIALRIDDQRADKSVPLPKFSNPLEEKKR